MIRKEFYLYNKESGDKEILVPVDVALVKIVVPSGINITAYGKLTKEDENYNGLMGIKSNDLKTYITMTNGLYTIDANGLYSIKFNSDTESSIKIRMIG